MADDVAEILELFTIAADFIDGLHEVYVDANGIARIVWFREEKNIFGGKMQRIVQARMLMPYGAMIKAAAMMVAALSVTPEQEPKRRSRLAELN